MIFMIFAPRPCASLPPCYNTHASPSPLTEDLRMIGKTIRLERILDRNTHRTVIVPMDHGVTLGPIPGLQDMKTTINRMVEGGANAIVIHKGIVPAGHRGGGKDVGLILHLSGSTVLSPDPNAKIPVCTVEEAIRFGADAVSLHVNLGAETDTAMLAHLADVSRRCSEWGIPLVAMMYPRGEKIDSQFDVRYVKHAARVAAELGADLVKVNYTGSPDTFAEVCAGCPIPVVIAGGEKMDSDRQILEMVGGALLAGAAGVSIGRNAFQHDDPKRIVQAIGMMVHGGKSITDALGFLQRGK
jgi:predicted phospho-2-dehydro-3-deoxyheptonate aldolase